MSSIPSSSSTECRSDGMGLPRAEFYFGNPGQLRHVENRVRMPQILCEPGPGPHLPQSWLDSGDGWITAFFTNMHTRDRSTQTASAFRCQAINPRSGKQCEFTHEESTLCRGTPCWTPTPFDINGDRGRLVAHLAQEHHIHAPVQRREWTTDLFSCCLFRSFSTMSSVGGVSSSVGSDRCTPGTSGHIAFDSLVCYPCMMSRMMMAFAGWEDTCNPAWSVLFTLPILPYVSSPLLRYHMVVLGQIDEPLYKTMFASLFCCCCSMVQVYRELSAWGVWPGYVTPSSLWCGEEIHRPMMVSPPSKAVMLND